MPAYINTAHRFKTKMCKNWVEKGACPYEWRCCYAHGEHELRSKIQNATDGVGTNDAIRAWQRAKRPPPPAFPSGASTASTTGKQHEVESSTDVVTPTTSTATATDVLKRSAPQLNPAAVAMPPPPSTGAPCRAAYEVRVPCRVSAAPRCEAPTRWRREPYARRLCSLAIAIMQEQLRQQQQQQQQQQQASVKPQPRLSRASASSGSSATAAFVACASPTVTAFETVGSTGSECGSTPRMPCPRLAAPSWADASCSYLSEA